MHSAGSASLIGNTAYSVELEKALSEFLGYEYVLLFPTGWGAGFGAIRALVRPADYVILDGLAHACLQEGATSATGNVHLHGHLKTERLKLVLQQIRGKDSVNGILVVTESLFSMDSDTPDLMKIRELCGEYGATLMVDCAHDLGSMGPRGRGHIGAQGLVGKLDLLMGSFSKTFASNGGFIATNNRSAYEYLKVNAGPWTFSNALSPVQAAVVLAALDIVQSAEGEARRTALMDNIVALRALLVAKDMVCLGDPSPIVPLFIGKEARARVMSRHLGDLGLGANLVEYPAVAKGAARFRLQVMAEHTDTQIEFAVAAVTDAMAKSAGFDQG